MITIFYHCRLLYQYCRLFLPILLFQELFVLWRPLIYRLFNVHCLRMSVFPSCPANIPWFIVTVTPLQLPAIFLLFSFFIIHAWLMPSIQLHYAFCQEAEISIKNAHKYSTWIYFTFMIIHLKYIQYCQTIFYFLSLIDFLFFELFHKLSSLLIEPIFSHLLPLAQIIFFSYLSVLWPNRSSKWENFLSPLWPNLSFDFFSTFPVFLTL